MATKKKILQAAAGNATGGAALNVEDVFSTYLYEGNGGSRVIENGVNLGQSFGSGSVQFDGSDYLTTSTELSLSGNFTVEAFVYKPENNVKRLILGGNSVNNQFYIDANNYLGIYDNSSELISTSPIPIGRWVHVAMTRSGSTVKFYIGGENFGSVTTSATLKYGHIGRLQAAGSSQQWVGNISNVRVVDGSVVYSANFTPPTSPLAAVTNTSLLTLQTSDPFVDNSTNAYTITQNGTPEATTFGPFDAAKAGEGGLVWTKCREDSNPHFLSDTVRGATKTLRANTDASERTDAQAVTSFNANGFSIGSDSALNRDGFNYASWTFRKAPKFFDVVTWTGNQTVRTISHNLGSVPGTIIIKNLDQSDGNATWQVWHRSLDDGYGNPQFLQLNTTAAKFSVGSWFNDTLPTSTEFTLGTGLGTNWSGQRFVAYLFAHNDGDGEFGPDGDADIIKCGSYTGTAPEIDLGFEPQWILTKNVSTANDYSDWTIVDNMRGLFADGENTPFFRINEASAEESNVNPIAPIPTPTGFRLTNSGSTTFGGTGSDTYIYIAIRRGTKVPESGTEVFDVDLQGNSTDPAFSSNFPVDLGFIFRRSGGDDWYVGDRLRGPQLLRFNLSAAEAPDSTIPTFDYMDGWGDNNLTAYTGWQWKRAPKFFDVVAYTGNGTAGRTVSHNLTVAPEMMWVKNRDSSADSWTVYVSSLGATQHMVLNNTNASSDAGGVLWNYTEPTDTVFTVGNNNGVNGSGSNIIAYLFASLDGISKVGSYTGTGATQTIDCGFTSGARFVLVKRTDSSTLGDWYVWDAERGIVAGNDPRLSLNTTSAEVAFDSIDPHSSGFSTVANGAADQSGASYIFYAIA